MTTTQAIMLAGSVAVLVFLAWLGFRPRKPDAQQVENRRRFEERKAQQDAEPPQRPSTPALRSAKGSAGKRPSKKRAALLEGRVELDGNGLFQVEAVGESHYQDALRRIVAKPQYAQKTVDAVLVPEDSNPHDSNAVRVEVEGMKVGYLSRRHAIVYRDALAEGGYPGAEAVCRARIFGGGDKMYGVWLDI